MHINFVEQGLCADCGSENIKPVNLVGGGPGENLLAFFECEDCGCKFIECYVYASKGMFPREEAEEE